MKTCIQSIGTATPGTRIPQGHILDFMLKAHRLSGNDADRLKALYRATGIHYRHSVISDYANGKSDLFPESEDLEPFPTVAQRMQVYRNRALGLAVDAIADCLLPMPSFRLSTITHLISVSCTGMYAPGLDIELIEKLGLSPSVERTAINYMGCYAAFNAIRVGDGICRSNPDASVLIVCIELCSIHFQKENSPDNLLANALFSDGAAAVIQSAKNGNLYQLQPQKFYCDLISQGKTEMSWSIGNFGFEMKLTSYVPEVIQSGIKQLITRLLAQTHLNLLEIDYFAIHPGGKRILEVIEKELNIQREKNTHAFDVLRECGNMSSASVLFVLKRIIDEYMSSSKEQANILGIAFGPGLTLESMVLGIRRC